MLLGVALALSGCDGSDDRSGGGSDDRSDDGSDGLDGRLAPYDMQRRLDLARQDAHQNAGAHVAGPRPHTAIAEALRRRRRDAGRWLARHRARPTSRNPVWRQARVVDLGDHAAVREDVKDLAFLSSQGLAHRAARGSPNEIREALAATG